MRCPKCGAINPPEEQLTYCNSCGTELRVVCPRCSADNPGFEEYCRECGLELHPDRGHERAAGIRVGNETISGGEQRKVLSRPAQVIIAVVIGAVLLWIPAFNAARKKGQFSTCQIRLHRLDVALQLYARDSDYSLPPAISWSKSLRPYIRDVNTFSCPSRPERFGYAFNVNLNERDLRFLAANATIAFFETPGSAENPSGTEQNWLLPPAHAKGNNFVFLDGQVKVLPQPLDLGYWAYTDPLLTQPTPTPVPTKKAGDGKNPAPGATGTSSSPTNPPPPTNPAQHGTQAAPPDAPQTGTQPNATQPDATQPNATATTPAASGPNSGTTQPAGQPTTGQTESKQAASGQNAPSTTITNPPPPTPTARP